MASSLAGNKALSNLVVKHYDQDPGDTSAAAIAWEAVESESLLVSVFRTVGTGTTTLTINAATSAAGANSTIVKADASAGNNALTDYNFLECTAEQVAQQGATSGYAFTHWSGVLTLGTGTDEMVATQIEYGLHNPRLNATVDQIA